MTKIWVLSHLVTEHCSGGAANFYRLAKIFNDLGYKSYVPVGKKYPHSDQEIVNKYWVTPEYFLKNLNPGDIVISPELWPEKVQSDKPIRRIKFVQNAMLYTQGGWEKHFIIYGSKPHNKLFKELYPWAITHEIKPYFNHKIFHPPQNISEKNPNKFIIIPRKSPEIAYKIAEKYPKNAIIAENKNEQQMADTYRKVGFLVFTSDIDGLGYSVIESYLSRSAVITWNCLGPHDLAINNYSALISPYKNFEKICSNIDKLLGNQELQLKLADNGRELVFQQFSYDRTLTQARDAINKILKDESCMSL